MDTCESCAFCAVNRRDGEMTCHRYPPTVVPILAQDPDGNPVLLGKVSLFAKVEASWKCGEFKRGVVVSNLEIAA